MFEPARQGYCHAAGSWRARCAPLIEAPHRHRQHHDPAEHQPADEAVEAAEQKPQRCTVQWLRELARHQHHPHPPGVHADAGGDVAGRGTHQAEQHPDRGQRQEGVRDRARVRKDAQRTHEQLEPAVRGHVRRGDVIAGEEVGRRVHHRGERDGSGGAGFPLDARVHRAAQAGLLDEADRQTAAKTQQHELRDPAGAEAGRARPVEQAERAHGADDSHHRRHTDRDPIPISRRGARRGSP